MRGLRVRNASEEDVPLILDLIRELAEYEKLSHEVVATEDGLRRSLFGERPAAEVLIGEFEGRPAAFALFSASNIVSMIFRSSTAVPLVLTNTYHSRNAWLCHLTQSHTRPASS